jgi:hypothetical protein
MIRYLTSNISRENKRQKGLSFIRFLLLFILLLVFIISKICKHKPISEFDIMRADRDAMQIKYNRLAEKQHFAESQVL